MTLGHNYTAPLVTAPTTFLINIQQVIKPTQNARFLAKFTPIHHWEGVNSNRAKNASFWGNEWHAVFAWQLSKTTNEAFEGNALTNKSPVEYFWFRQICLPNWAGEVAKGPKNG